MMTVMHLSETGDLAVDTQVPETSQLIAGGAARSSMRAMSGIEFLRALMDGTPPAPAFAPTNRNPNTER